MKRFSILLVAMAVMLSATLDAADDKGKKKRDPLAKAKCPVSGKAVKAEHAVAFKGAKAYFCCPNCPKAFEKDTAKFATKANHQLVLTRQARQVKCPLAGKAVNKEQSVKVAGVNVSFCCGNCKGKVAAAEGDAQLELAFSDAAFAKGFKVGKKSKKK